jgi:hypothetical protein
VKLLEPGVLALLGRTLIAAPAHTSGDLVFSDLDESLTS